MSRAADHAAADEHLRAVADAFDTFCLDPSARLIRMSHRAQVDAPIDTFAESWIWVGRALQRAAHDVWTHHR